MKKLLCFLFSILFIINAKAFNYDLPTINASSYNFNEDVVSVSKKVDNAGHIKKISNGNYIGYGVGQNNIANVFKWDDDYNTIWSNNVIVKANFGDGSKNVKTTILDVAVLKDESVIVVGYSWGLLREHTGIQFAEFGQDDDFDAVFVRFSETGQELYKKEYRSIGLDDAIKVAALNNGGYLIKYYVVRYDFSLEPTDFKFDIEKPKYYYIEYDSNNNVVTSFSSDESLKNYSFINSNDYDNMKNAQQQTDIWTNSKKQYMGKNVYNESFYFEEKNNKLYLVIYDSNNNKKNEFDINALRDDKSLSEISLSDIQYHFFLITIDGGFIFDKKIFDKDGNNIGVIVADYLTKLGQLKYDKFFIGKNDEIVFIGNNLELFSINATSTGDFANLYIGDKKISNSVGLIIENDRTYINLNTYCSLMDCNFKMSETNKNKVIIEFNAFNNNKQIDYENIYQSNLVNKHLKYVVTHDIGSNSYTSYLSVPNQKIFKLISPSFDSSKVDVVSKFINDNIYVPLRFLSEAVGLYVTYEPNGDNGKPNIRVSNFGEGEFYEKYKVGFTYNDYQEGDIFNDSSKLDTYKLKWGSGNQISVFGYEVNTNKIINVNKSIILLANNNLVYKDLYTYDEDGDDYDRSDKYPYGLYNVDNNTISYGLSYHDDNGKEGEKNIPDGRIGFFGICNIKGYPFINYAEAIVEE